MQGSLFDQNPLLDQDSSSMQTPISEQLEIYGANLVLVRHWLPSEQAQACFETLERTCQWRQPTIHIAGRSLPIPRMQSWYGDEPYVFKYSGMTFLAEAMPQLISDIRGRIRQDFGCYFNSVLVNCYRDERDSVGWHADDEPEFGPKPIIASLSLGETRRFGLKPKSTKQDSSLYSPCDGFVRKKPRAKYLDLHSGDLLIMKGATQELCVHNVPKETKKCSRRINLTFRYIVGER